MDHLLSKEYNNIAILLMFKKSNGTMGNELLVKRVTTTQKANKGARRMPRQQEPKKDVISCEKLGRVAH